MKPVASSRTYSNYQFDEYNYLPVTVLEHFEWAHEDNHEG